MAANEVCLNLWHCRKRGVNRLTRHIALNIVVCHSPRKYRPHSLPDSPRRLWLRGPSRCKAGKYIAFPDGVDLHVHYSWEHIGYERTDPLSRGLSVAPSWEVDTVHLKRSLTECGRTARLFSAIGLTPLATSDLFHLARSPASARLTVGYLGYPGKAWGKYLAERKGFEPLVPLQAHTISSRACSSTPAPLRDEVIQIFCQRRWFRPTSTFSFALPRSFLCNHRRTLRLPYRLSGPSAGHPLS